MPNGPGLAPRADWSVCRLASRRFVATGWASPTDAEMLRHLRGPGPHVLGCHALDAVLGRS
jgi:hypothetical protein